MLSSHLRLGLPSGLLPSGLPIKIIEEKDGCQEAMDVHVLIVEIQNPDPDMGFQNSV
jgi:hypothetical protein